MRIYNNVSEFEVCINGSRKWKRFIEAIGKVKCLSNDEAYSIGDSITFWTHDLRCVVEKRFIGSRRYQTVLYSVSGTAYIDIADKGNLLPVERYSDLNDREYFVGSGETVQLHEGGILLIDMSEAFKILQQSYGVLMQAQVTVEGFSFPNK